MLTPGQQQQLDHYYAIINFLWGRSDDVWLDSVYSDIEETGGDTGVIGTVTLVTNDDIFADNMAGSDNAWATVHEVLDNWNKLTASNPDAIDDMGTIKLADAIIGNEVPNDMPGIELAFDHAAGGYTDYYQRVYQPGHDTSTDVYRELPGI